MKISKNNVPKVMQELGLDDAREFMFVTEYCKDLDCGRAALQAGYADPSYGYQLRDKPQIQSAVEKIMVRTLERTEITAEDLLWQLYDNSRIVLSKGNISASNTALGLLMKHSMIDAMAASKVDVATDEQVVQKLLRARKRVANLDDKSDNEDINSITF